MYHSNEHELNVKSNRNVIDNHVYLKKRKKIEHDKILH